MRRAPWLVLLAACSGSPAVRAPGSANTGGASPLEAPEWAAFVEGATFTLVQADDPVQLVARVERVEATPDKRTIHLAWSGVGHDHDRETIEITADHVVFVERRETFARAPDPDDPDHDGHDDPANTSRVARTYPQLGKDGAVCYVDEQPPAEGACDDVCIGQLCVDPKLGLVGGFGIGWPNLGSWERAL